MEEPRTIRLSNGVVLKPSGRPAPRLSDHARMHMELSDLARAETGIKAQFVVMGGDNSPEALAARGYDEGFCRKRHEMARKAIIGKYKK